MVKAQKPYSEHFWRYYLCTRRIVDERDETPFPLDDMRMDYTMVCYTQRLGEEAQYAPLRKLQDPVHHPLLAYPTLQRVAVTSRLIDDEFWMGVVNSGSSISAGDLVAGLMARAAELSSNCFRTAAREL